MKKVKYLAMLLAAGMFAACSDNLEDAGAGNSGGTTPSTTEGYVKVAINMPTTSGNVSRVDDGSYVDLEDGLEKEYKVNNGYIVFFSAAKTITDPDNDATFVSAYDLGNLTQQDVANNQQVSTLVSTITEAPLVGSNNKLYALIILNPSSNIQLTGTGSGARGLKIGESELTAGTSKLSALQEKLSNQNVSSYTGTSDKPAFTMCNAPLSNKANTHTTATEFVDKTLVEVDVYDNETDARGADPNQIYVERVVAKVTLAGFTYSNSQYTKNVVNANNVYDGDQVILTGWTLNVTNKSTKLVRDAGDIATWMNSTTYGAVKRFVGTTEVGTGAGYRIYWAEDGNYDGKDYNNEFNIYVTGTAGTGETTITESDWNKDAEHDDKSFPLYCLENTMGHNQQNKNQTTGVILKTTYLAKIGNEQNATAGDFFICGTDPTAYRAHTQTGDSPATGLLEKMEGLFDPQIDIELKSGTLNGGTYNSTNLNDLVQKVTDGSQSNLSSDEIETIWNALGEIRYYKNGDSYYYTMLIRHFDDTEGVIYTAGTDNGYAEKHLGRYGVVRNNWYELNVKSISGPGEPDVDNPGGGPDDDNEGYINCTINVLSWAKRAQDVEL